jgi:hypothetical protein
MSEFRLQNELFRNEEVLEDYVDVYIHCEDNSIVEGHMLILAQQSPFCHRFFQSRKMKVADMIFPNIRHSVVRNAIRIMYGKVVNVSKSDSKRVCSFLNMLQVKYKVVSIEEESMEKKSAAEDNIVIRHPTGSIEDDQSGKGGEEGRVEKGREDRAGEIGSKDDQSKTVVDDEVPTAIEPKEHNVMDSLENWTLTTTDWDKVDEIGHTIERDDAHNRKVYKCKYCPVSSKAFNYAEKHYINKHKNLTAEVDCLSSVQARRSRILKNFDELSKTGVNTTLVKHESTVTLGDLETLASELSNLPTNLPVHLDYKKKDFVKKLSADILSVKSFIDKI